jgi:hypothetical protein
MANICPHNRTRAISAALYERACATTSRPSPCAVATSTSTVAQSGLGPGMVDQDLQEVGALGSRASSRRTPAGRWPCPGWWSPQSAPAVRARTARPGAGGRQSARAGAPRPRRQRPSRRPRRRRRCARRRAPPWRAGEVACRRTRGRCAAQSSRVRRCPLSAPVNTRRAAEGRLLPPVCVDAVLRPYMAPFLSYRARFPTLGGVRWISSDGRRSAGLVRLTATGNGRERDWPRVDIGASMSAKPATEIAWRARASMCPTSASP